VSQLERYAPSAAAVGTGLLLDAAGAAVYLGRTQRWVLESLRDGTLPGRKIRGRWVISRPQLDAWLVGEAVPRTRPARRLLAKGRPRAA
jgi:excisionase family DNA binding protein